jgi:DNA mismatch repair protein MutS
MARCYGSSWADGFQGFSSGEVLALANLLAYVSSVIGSDVANIQRPRRSGDGDTMEIDQATLRGLEVFTSASGRDGALISVLDRTVTGAGARLLARQLAAPLTDPATIKRRLSMVRSLHDDAPLRLACREELGKFPDILRASGRLSIGKAGPRDLGAIRDGIASAARVSEVMRQAENLSPGLSAVARDLGKARGQELAMILMPR